MNSSLLLHRQSDESARVPRLWQLAAVAALLGSTAYGTLMLNALTDKISTLWPCNGLLIGVLLRVPRRHWISYLAVAFAVDLGVNFAMVGGDLSLEVLFSLCNTIEVLIAAVILGWLLPSMPELSQSDQLVKFLIFGVVVAPAVASVIARLILVRTGNPSAFPGYGSWFLPDALGVALMTPLFLTLSRRGSQVRRSPWEVLGLFVMILTATLVVFGQDKYPLLFIISPFLLIAGVRLGIAGASLGLIIVTILGGYLTSFGHGPVALISHASKGEHILIFQFFIAASMLMLYGAEVMMRRNNDLQQAVATSEVRFRLLTETSKDIIMLSDLDGRRQYVSPAVTELLGWSPEQFMIGTYLDSVHPDDLEVVSHLVDDCRNQGALQSATYRYRKVDGDYLWMETTGRLYFEQDSSHPVGIVAVMRDVSQRKAAEEKLHEAYKTAEALASLDSLTGLANRRRLDEVLLLEWRRAAREQTNISLLMFDVDCFKAYNDLYGHVPGDSCLRQIAGAASAVVRRPGDLIARFGGEEFAVILPNTDAEGSREIAEEIRLTIERRALPHTGNPRGIITVSIGSATMIPSHVSSCARLIDAADRALYHAKDHGRNQVRSAGQLDALDWHGAPENGGADSDAQSRAAAVARQLPPSRTLHADVN